MLSNDKLCERHFAINTLEYRNDLDIAGLGKARSYATVSLRHWAEPQQMRKMKKIAKISLFAFLGRHNEPVKMKYGV